MTCKDCIHFKMCDRHAETLYETQIDEINLNMQEGVPYLQPVTSRVYDEGSEKECPDFTENFPKVGSPCWFENVRNHSIDEGIVQSVHLCDGYYIVQCDFNGDMLTTRSTAPSNYIFFDKEDIEDLKM